MGVIRVVVAEDSLTVRELIVSILSEDPAFEVVGRAKNGLEAIELVRELSPHLVTMDVSMPVLDGFEATRRIMMERPTPIVIVSNSYDAKQVQLSMRALRAGALTALPKPVGPSTDGFEDSKRRFLRTLKSMAEVKVVRLHSTAQSRVPRSDRSVVAVAASTGGPAAISQIFEALPADFPAPILIVQHMAHEFMAGFASWLSTTCPITVTIAENGEQLKPGFAYLAAGDRHLGVDRQERVLLHDGDPIAGFRPSANYLFQSLAASCGPRGIGVVLTGMGKDGSEGLSELKSSGGHVLAQDEKTSVIWGMPRAAIERGAVDEILSLQKIAPALNRLVKPRVEER